MAKLLAFIPTYRESKHANILVKTLLDLWENSREAHPYIFYMGNDFRKLKAPACWYDIRLRLSKGNRVTMAFSRLNLLTRR